jgi:hypothetical protein
MSRTNLVPLSFYPALASFLPSSTGEKKLSWPDSFFIFYPEQGENQL